MLPACRQAIAIAFAASDEADARKLPAFVSRPAVTGRDPHAPRPRSPEADNGPGPMKIPNAAMERAAGRSSTAGPATITPEPLAGYQAAVPIVRSMRFAGG